MKGSAVALVRVAVVAGVILLGVASASAAPILSTWEDGTLGGWTFTPNSYGTWGVATSGGNPGGYVRFFDTNSSTLYVGDTLHAPSAFLGDYSSLVNPRLEWDMKVERTAAIGATILLSDPTGSNKYMYTTPVPGTNWAHYSVPIQSENWVRSNGTWAGLMANVAIITIVGDICSGYSTTVAELCLDNVAITPEPASLALLAVTGLAMAVRRRR